METSPVDQIKQRLDVSDVVGGYIKLQKAGRNFRAVCPFHKEKTPSFFVSPERQSWHCFGCNRGGDIFSFVQEIEGVEFIDALRTLAQRAGVELKRTQPDAFKNIRARLEEASELAAEFFETQLLKSKAGQAAQAYLKSRGLQDATIQNFRIGFAPNTDNGLSQFLQTRSFSADEIVSSGLATGDKGYGIRDRFRGRVMFPIMDRNGKVLGFSGRIFGREAGDYDPKYLNTPETPLFDKGRTLFGLNHARLAIREQNAVVLVEGQMDCVMSHQAGVSNTVATSGTALTEQHLRILRRIAETLIVAFDMDAAGNEAARRGVEMALEEGFLVRVAAVPSGKDPADFIQQDASAWQDLVAEHTQPIIGFFIAQAVKVNEASLPEGKRRIAQSVLPLIAKVGNAIEQSQWVEELARVLSVRPEGVWQELSKVKKSAKALPNDPAVTSGDASLSDRRLILEEHLLCLLLGARESRDMIVPEQFLHPPFREIALCVKNAPDDAQNIGELLPEALRAHFEPLAFRAETLREQGLDVTKECDMCVRGIKTLDLRERLDALSLEIEVAERAGDSPRLETLMGNFRDKMHELSSILSAQAL